MNIKEQINKGITIYNIPLKVTFYARVSTESITQVTSITNQVEYFKEYIKRIPGWTMIDGYIDEGISGKSVKNRKNFLKMIKDAKEGKFNLILTKSVSRFARNTIDSIYYTELLNHYDIGVFFINDNINTLYKDSEFRLTLMASIAQDELRKLSESIQFGLNESIKRGIVLGNNNILGYKKNKGKLMIIDKEAKIVKDIFNLYITKEYNYLSLTKKINKKYNLNFDSKRIKRILTNYKYKGYYCGKKSKIIDYKNNVRKNYSKNDWIMYKDYNKVPPIISEEIWNKANKLISQKEKKLTNIYINKVLCFKHQKYLVLKRKKYKNKYYNYLICPKCISISLSLINRININNYQKIIITKENKNVLKLTCKK